MSECVCPYCSEINDTVHNRKTNESVLINTPSTLNASIEYFALIKCKKCKKEFQCNKIRAFGFLKLWQTFAILFALFILMLLITNL